jgi:hypothetical protein
MAEMIHGWREFPRHVKRGEDFDRAGSLGPGQSRMLKPTDNRRIKDSRFDRIVSGRLA